MDSGLYAAYTGFLARTQALDTAANNLANAGTAGFRAQRDYFSGVLAGGVDQDPETASQVGQSVNGFGVLGGNRLDLGQGEIKATGNPLDLALEGQGFFAIQTSNGVRYTRDGAFSRSPTGVLQTAQGEPVLDDNQKPITIPTGSIYVSPDGSISVSTADGSMIVGRVGAFDFAEKSVSNRRRIESFLREWCKADSSNRLCSNKVRSKEPTKTPFTERCSWFWSNDRQR